MDQKNAYISHTTMCSSQMFVLNSTVYMTCILHTYITQLLTDSSKSTTEAPPPEIVVSGDGSGGSAIG